MNSRKSLIAFLVGLSLLAILILAAAPPAVRERIAIYAREDSWIANGMDIIWYTGNLSGETHRVDGAGGVRVVAPTAVGTATPALVVDNSGAGNVLVEFRDAGTPVWTVGNSGDTTLTGGQTYSNWLKVSAPTSIATATPAMVVDSLGVSNLFEVRDAATPVAAVNDGGNWLIGPADGTGVDVTWYSDTTGDTMLWDQSEEALTITGTNGQDALNVDDGNVDIDDDLDVNGTANLDDVDVDLNSSMNVDGHMLDVGTGSYATADGDNDVGVAGDLEVDNALDVDGPADIAGNITDSDSAVTFADNVIVDGAADVIQLAIQGNGTQTNSLLVLEQSDGTDKLTVSNEGQVIFSPEADSDGANYDEWVTITGDMTGTGTKDRNYGLLIEMTRPAGQEIGNGDHDEAGLKIRVDTEAVTTTTGTVLRAIDAESKADNPSGTVTNLYGVAATAKSDTGAGSVGTMIALTANSQANAAVTDAMMAADLRLFRQSANEPTAEYVMQVRNSSTTGSGADAGIYLSSDYGSSATTDSLDYGVDMSGAAINTADLRLENGETINNGTDTAIQIGGFLAFTEGSVIDLASGGTITPTASYQPITNATGGSINTDATTAIADGAVAGAILIITNEDAQDIVIKDGANTILSGDTTLTGGANDTLTLIWNGADWVGVSFIDN